MTSPHGDKHGGPPPPNSLSSATPWRVGSALWDFGTTLVMGVVNVTPDSFSDGGCFLRPDQALARAKELAREGADIIDFGGASSHPAASPVDPETEMRRVAPVIEAVRREIALPLSIDTIHPAVADHCLGLGADLINDVSGLHCHEMARVAARHGAPLVITHNGWNLPPRPAGTGLMKSIADFFRERVAQAEEMGLQRLILDPGYGFGKSLEENLILLRSLSRLRPLGRPVLICTSRKGSLGRIAGEPVPAQRLGASLASGLFAAFQGAAMVRVHDVKPFRQALKTWQAIKSAPRE